VSNGFVPPSARLIVAVLAGLAGSACAGHRKPVATSPSQLVRADTLLAAGCYRCLEEAQTIYERLAGSSRRDRATARARAFDAVVLLAMRDRELGLRADDHAPTVRSRLPSQTGGRAAPFVAVMELVPWPVYAATGAERDAMLVPKPEAADTVARLRTELAALPASDVTAQYLLQTLDCQSPGDPPDEQSRQKASSAVPALLLYRAATCGVPDIDTLESLKKSDPRFEEIELAVGNAALNGGALLSAEHHHTVALRAFPGMLPAAMQLGRVHVMLEEYEASLPEYQQVLDVVSDQVDAMLGKARALSALGRPTEAIPILDRIIAMGTWLVGDAYYWRAWNRFQMKELDVATSDVDASLRLMSNARVHFLAGSIASARNEWPRAQAELEAALKLDETDCDIPLALAGVLARLESWAAAAQRFGSSAECLVQTQARYQSRLEEIHAAPMDDVRRARFIARTDAARKTAHNQEGLARFNAGVASARADQPAEARRWVLQAREWPEWRERAEALLARLR
jgi:tetratricopeptide (TPR) repeat protein